MPELILLRHRDIPEIADLDVYLKHDGFKAFEDVVKNQTPEQVIETVKKANLRGRGGAGFPAGVKWSFLTPGVFPRYVVANADESEPGTFKDREIMEGNPYQFLEGVAICSYAAQANTAYIYCRGEFWDLAHELEGKIEALYKRRLLGEGLFDTDYSLRIYVHLGAGAYICGEETALLSSIEGNLGFPRLRPPFPAAEGLFAQPTVVNNVETLTNLPPIINKGADWYRSIGTEKSSGPKIFCLSGHVERPGNYELPLGTTFRELIYEHGGGIRDGKAIKGILPAGASAPLLPATDEVLDTPMDYESVPKVGSQLGSASVIVLDETVDIAWMAYKTTSFFKHESCGKCTPCREGTYWMYHILNRFNHGTASPGDIDLLNRVALGIQGKCFCALGEFSITPVVAGLEHFRSDFEARTGNGK
ncbi:MAG TPA: NADH-quinone oxidoreductase subunit NuoF [Anaerolineales bacterium]|nr:NADH-quinone oxidoreductase subunit NuoF [Anaerolineales bacterium]HUS85112.1 NADH-quinone oxidoreductase subunit NuoF [Anaerolineales bacterium]